MSEETKETAETGAVRSKLYPTGKFAIRLDLLMRNSEGLRRLAETYGEGVVKYGPDNWMKGFKESVYIAHAMEHMRLYLGGDTSEDHLAHATWNIFSLMWVQANKPELMDLTKPEQVLYSDDSHEQPKRTPLPTTGYGDSGGSSLAETLLRQVQFDGAMDKPGEEGAARRQDG